MDAKQAKLEKKLEDLLRQTAEVFVSVAIHGA
ncbi:MAG: hypothetical protein ACI814_000786, partial [Mariniblastus sp.]